MPATSASPPMISLRVAALVRARRAIAAKLKAASVRGQVMLV